ncbi:FHA domain-containing protein [Paenibacillus protaetiae]|uniref:FHA domain-containing protein n=1 Tax=Paenibacillus protaetiae TaxID=2509456 RepID=A0A4P6EVT7_9BACL|nr:FHA domain-containing protein [Paenibacillus protaetiae]QAY65809.1 FHA domain-containing protein [Paenibacillus protaetiae]
MDDFASLYIIRGEPFQSGTCVNFNKDELLVGRVSNQSAPDLAFTNAFISRQHFVIRKEQDKAVLYDLGSRHGTEINGVRLIPHTPYPLKNFDIIKLSKGMSVIHFSYRFADATLDLEPLSITSRLDLSQINWEKRECIVEGKRIPMSEKEYLLIRVLYEKANRLVSVEEIKSQVWPERSLGANGVPDVTLDELNSLIYRVRKKFGKDAFLINAVRGSGYMLESRLKSS